MARTAGRTDFFRAMVSSFVAAPIAIPFSLGLTALTDIAPHRAESAIVTLMVLWPVYAAIYLAWSLRTYSVLATPSLRDLARRDERGERNLGQRLTGATGVVNVLAAAVSAAIVVLFVIGGSSAFRGQPAYLGVGLLNVAASWALMVHTFAQSYLRLDARGASGTHLELSTPGPARFQDFLDLAVMVSTMGAALPVQPRSRSAWRVLRTNTLVAFTFNSVIIAMLASLLVGGVTG